MHIKWQSASGIQDNLRNLLPSGSHFLEIKFSIRRIKLKDRRITDVKQVINRPSNMFKIYDFGIIFGLLPISDIFLKGSTFIYIYIYVTTPLTEAIHSFLFASALRSDATIFANISINSTDPCADNHGIVLFQLFFFNVMSCINSMFWLPNCTHNLRHDNARK